MNDCFWKTAPRLLFLISYTPYSNCYICFSFITIINSFASQLSLHYYWYCINQKHSPRWCSAKKVFLQISQNSQEKTSAKDLLLMKLQIYRVKLDQKRDSSTYVFLWILGNVSWHFFKEPFRWLVLHKHSFCFLSHNNFAFSKNDVTHIFQGVFSGLNLRIGNKIKPLARSLFLSLPNICDGAFLWENS